MTLESGTAETQTTIPNMHVFLIHRFSFV